MATAQAGGARPRREAEPPGEEAQSGQGAAAGGSGKPGAARVQVSAPPARRSGSPLGSCMGLGLRAVPAARADPGVGRGGRAVPAAAPSPPPCFSSRLGSCPAACVPSPSSGW